MTRRQRRANLTALLIGLAATAATLVVYALGGLDWIELKTFDWRCQIAGDVPEDERLACVDIDDEALQLVGRWPWPRDVQAGILSVLHEAGASALLYDITLSEPEAMRSIVAEQADVGGDPLHWEAQDALLAFPDHELRTTIADVGGVYLAFDYGAGGLLQSAEFAGLLDAVRAGDETAARERAATLASQGADRPLLWAKIVHALETQPLLDEHALADAVGTSPLEPTSRVQDCRQMALIGWIREWLAADPQRWQQPAYDLFAALHAELIEPAEATRGRYRLDVAKALRSVLSYAATTRPGTVPLDTLAPVAEPVAEIAPVYFPLARAARGCGFVVFKDDVDGVVRRIRLVVQHEGHVLPELAFAVALDAMQVTTDGLSARPGVLTVRRGDTGGTLTVQLDEHGQAVVPWTTKSAWTEQFGEHVPAGAVWQVCDNRLAISHNEGLLLDALGRLLVVGRLTSHEQLHGDLKRYLELGSERRLARYRDDAETTAEIDNWISQYQTLLTEAWPQLAADAAAEIARLEADGGVEAEALRDLRDIERVLAANKEYDTTIDEALKLLRSRVSGKICMIGYTATSLADLRPFPTMSMAPGIMAHANLLNGLLTGRMVRWAPPAVNILLAACCGVLASLLSVHRSPRVAGLRVAVLLLLLVGVAGWWAFRAYTFWIAITPAVAAMLLSHLAIAGYRYVFIEREQRQLATALSQYTSATLARKMSEDAELCRRAETRVVTAVFTDFKGFTAISERIGAERTQHVLNTCLGRCSEVMLAYEAPISKFIGDGIFVFWNPLIYPQPDHARRACETAVDLHRALRDLADEQRRAGGDETFAELVLRVGVATGPAVVGPCGSEQKYDYTCIGDTVNLAARLESANKFYGTRSLVAGSTHDVVGESFGFRPLGGVQVIGKRQPVPIFELLGRADEINADDREYADRFGQAVALFQERAWEPARSAFTACREQRSADLAAQRYVEAIDAFGNTPPGPDWSGAIELREK
ncbi:MAG: CHASE2 domain-containing protein [Phycisphaerae bacterium]